MLASAADTQSHGARAGVAPVQERVKLRAAAVAGSGRHVMKTNGKGSCAPLGAVRDFMPASRFCFIPKERMSFR